MTCRRWWPGALLLGALVQLPADAAGQVTPGQRDDFEDGTTQSWRVNAGPGPGGSHPAPPTNVATGGPAGAGDNYLLVTAVGGPGGDAPAPGSRLSVINFNGQWAGNYTAAGITHIRVDAINLGSTDLLLRLIFENAPLMGPPTDIAVSGAPLALAPGSGWTSLLFPLYGPGGLTPVPGPLGPSNVAALLASTTMIRIAHVPSLELGPTPIVARLGVDNITAMVIPEPSTVLLVGTGVLGLLLVRRRRPH